MHILLSAIDSVLNGKNRKFVIDKELYALSKQSHITPFLFVSCDDNTDSSIKTNLLKDFKRQIVYDENQKIELQRIRKALDESRIRYSVLKGIHIKALYPESYYRYMCDFDILVDKNNLKKVGKVLESIGYVKGLTSDHDITFTNGSFHIELHYRLIARPETGGRFFKKPFNKMKPLEGKFEYVFTKKEDEYIFYFFHLLKHYVEKGIGVRNFIDLYLFNKKYFLDWDYINKSYKYTKFQKECEDIERFTKMMFSDTQYSNSFFVSILKYKTYGTLDLEIKNELKQYSSFKWILKRIFPSVTRMIDYYPFLIHRVNYIFLPFLYIHHIFIFSVIRGKYSLSKIRKVRKFEKEKN